MWKRENEPAPTSPSTSTPAPPAPVVASRNEPESPAAPAPPRQTLTATSSSRAIIGPSIELTGELSGGEDLLVEGRIQGKIRLAQHSVTVGAKGRVSADVQARIVEIEGEVDGHLSAEEVIVLRKSARVRGDLSAPRVVIEDGAKFKGTIDMEPKRGAASVTPAASSAGPRPVPADEPARAAAPAPAGASTRAS